MLFMGISEIAMETRLRRENSYKEGISGHSGQEFLWGWATKRLKKGAIWDKEK